MTAGVKIISHLKNSKSGKWEYGTVHIGKNLFLGMNTLIVKPIHIGDNSIIGAGSVVTKDIPENEVWAGNPARFIKKRN